MPDLLLALVLLGLFVSVVIAFSALCVAVALTQAAVDRILNAGREVF